MLKLTLVARKGWGRQGVLWEITAADWVRTNRNLSKRTRRTEFTQGIFLKRSVEREINFWCKAVVGRVVGTMSSQKQPKPLGTSKYSVNRPAHFTIMPSSRQPSWSKRRSEAYLQRIEEETFTFTYESAIRCNTLHSRALRKQSV